MEAAFAGIHIQQVLLVSMPTTQPETRMIASERKETNQEPPPQKKTE